MGVLLLLFEHELVEGSIFVAEANVAEVILAVKFAEELLSILVGFLLVNDIAEGGINNEDNALSEDVVMAEHCVYHFHSSEIKLLLVSQLQVSEAARLVLDLLLFLLGQNQFNIFKSFEPPKVDRLLASDVQRICVPLNGLLGPIHRVEEEALQIGLVLLQLLPWDALKAFPCHETLSILVLLGGSQLTQSLKHPTELCHGAIESNSRPSILAYCAYFSFVQVTLAIFLSAWLLGFWDQPRDEE